MPFSLGYTKIFSSKNIKGNEITKRKTVGVSSCNGRSVGTDYNMGYDTRLEGV